MRQTLKLRTAVFAFVAVSVAIEPLASAEIRDRSFKSGPAEACGDPNAPVRRGDVECLTRVLISTRFPELERAWNANRISFREFRSNAYFLKTAFRHGKLASRRSDRTYSIDVNPRVYEGESNASESPSLLAIEGILGHELVHLVDYERGIPLDIARLGIRVLIHPARLERNTDERAFARGFAEGIRAYRVWIYGKLSPKALRRKRTRYYTPEEIDRWLAKNPGRNPRL